MVTAELFFFYSNKTAAATYIHPACLLFIYLLTHHLLNTPLAEEQEWKLFEILSFKTESFIVFQKQELK